MNIVQMIVVLMVNPFINYDISQGTARKRCQIQWFIQDRKLFLSQVIFRSRCVIQAWWTILLHEVIQELRMLFCPLVGISTVEAGSPASYKPSSSPERKEREAGKQFPSWRMWPGRCTHHLGSHLSGKELFSWSHRAARKAETFRL